MKTKTTSKNKVLRKITKRLKQNGYCVWRVAEFTEDTKSLLVQLHESLNANVMTIWHLHGSSRLDEINRKGIDNITAGDQQVFVFIEFNRKEIET